MIRMIRRYFHEKALQRSKKNRLEHEEKIRKSKWVIEFDAASRLRDYVSKLDQKIIDEAYEIAKLDGSFDRFGPVLIQVRHIDAAIAKWSYCNENS